MKVGDLIRHRKSEKLALIIKEFNPMENKPYHYYYKLLWLEEDVETVAPLDVLLKLWENISDNSRNSNI